ncbi:MAG: hypothetical protein ACC656_14760 [Candidatus Heimdallarchaeota archaeon]
MTVGTIVKLKVPCMGNSPGTKGVAFNDYQQGCQFIFENGDYDGFSNELDNVFQGTEQSAFLEEIGFDDKITNYQFKNVMQVTQDFRNGVFNSALK